MQTSTEDAAPVRPVTEEAPPCRICPATVDLRRLCAVWPDGTVAHVECYNAHWLETGIADELRAGGAS